MKTTDKKGSVLVIDDNEDVLKSLNMFLKHEFDVVELLSEPNKIPTVIESLNPDVILLDMNFSPGSRSGLEGIYWLNKIIEIDPKAVVILLTAYGDMELAIKSIKEGATDFITKPWDNDKLLATLKSAQKLSIANQEVSNLKQKQKLLEQDIKKEYEILWGESKVMKDLFETVKKVSKTDTNILLIGENGTGKDLISREIHDLSNRSSESFVKVDMGSLSESVFESEMFGHVKGAYTDAKEERIGRFELANKGTLFMDEIGNLSLYLQAKLLTSIQNMEITKIGSNKAKQINTRIITASNRDIHKMVKENLFRQDLLYRIETIRLEVPPLRERGDDTFIFVYHFLKKFGKKYSKPNITLNSDALNKLKTYHWPGNIRELQHTIEKAVILNESGVLKADDFVFRSSEKEEIDQINSLNLSELERSAIEKSLIKNNFNLSRAANELGITRPTLYKKIRKYAIQL
ncbi:MAG: sigma-54-dependent Fis family transcriptional regulator [Marinilabiliales bacterium]|mgnify:CR=1 FL=1|nr:MAG: sigma-54-dependent Fis family transcriptional regulator [Marinilabiliales bacterium]